MQIAGLEIGLPRNETEVGPEWLTKALHASGALGAGGRVSLVATTRIGEGVGLLSRLFRLRLTYEGDAAGAPSAVVLKLPTDDPNMRFLANSLNAYGREIKFYREIAAGSPFGSAQCHAAMIDQESGDFVLVMEDLAHLRNFDQVNGCSWEEAEAVCDVLANFHAQWHGHRDLPALSETFWCMKNPVYPTLLPSMFSASWPVAKRVLGGELSADMLRFGDHWNTLSSYFFDQLADTQTLVHGDFRADNLFQGDGKITALDFQIASQGPGIYDLAYFVSQSITPQVRGGRDKDLVARYLARMASLGIELDEAETWRMYQLCLAYCLIYPMAVFQSWDVTNERGQELMRSLLMRCASAIEDTGALATFPAEAWVNAAS